MRVRDAVAEAGALAADVAVGSHGDLLMCSALAGVASAAIGRQPHDISRHRARIPNRAPGPGDTVAQVTSAGRQRR